MTMATSVSISTSSVSLKANQECNILERKPMNQETKAEAAVPLIPERCYRKRVLPLHYRGHSEHKPENDIHRNEAEFDEFFKYCGPDLDNRLVVMMTNRLRRFYRPYSSCYNFWISLLSLIPILHWLPK
ncbi:hypothetical protein KIN20_002090 [Parelaphostrongylus tenuis]|uniref:Uncharacterized protein n=1 Tax=Parelaphostrongylus tenuis TaxID=148309 RepID=A0AAD5LXZ4_PARTN|nr:hypothetical protein KIN20_002090 [Parelaphostrongylus tenuis]